MSESEKGFEVKDKRKAREALEDKGETAPESKQEQPREEAAQEQDGTWKQERPEDEGPGQGPAAEAGDEGRELPPVDFLSFIGSLAATAFMHMGEKLSPEHPQMPVDLAAAKQMIDLIDLIKAKTKGNLEKHEEDGLEAMLYNLRMRYLHQSSGKQAGSES